jgi:hypothetical protein
MEMADRPVRHPVPEPLTPIPYAEPDFSPFRLSGLAATGGVTFGDRHQLITC